MTTPYAYFWRHIEECDHCARVERFLCPTGEALLQQASDGMAKQIAPMPKEPGKA
jgi:hypothetical protein